MVLLFLFIKRNFLFYDRDLLYTVICGEIFIFFTKETELRL